ncbi:MAG: P-loop NTPase family protein [Gemmatimonadaceae bacterium]
MTATAATALSLDTLRRRLAAVVDGERPTAPGLATGIPALDLLLPGNGLPRGRLTEVLGTRSSGRTTILRQMVATTRRRGGWVAWVDAGRTLAPQDWATAGPAMARGSGGPAGMDDGCGGGRGSAPLWVVRPPSAARAAWCADVLLRSGAFALVVLDGAPVLSHATAVRLTRLARDADAALVVLGGERDGERGGTRLGGAVRLRVERRQVRQHPEAPAGVRALRIRDHSPAPPPSRSTVRFTGDPRPPGASRMHVTIEKGGSRQSVEVSCDVGVARRLCAHPEVPDRRGVAAAGGGAGTVGRGGGAAGGAAVAPSRASPGARVGRGARRPA